MDQKQYEEYIKNVTPTNRIGKNVCSAFFFGGMICTLGQFLSRSFMRAGMEKEDASLAMLLCLIGLSVLFTGFHWFQKLAKIAGAGVLVPITGFANSIAAPAIEYQKHGQVFGVGCRIFMIAGPVILYGIFSSWVLGFFYYLLA